jgi:hypothetical protein
MKQNQVQPDVSSYEYLIKCLCQALRPSEAQTVATEMEKLYVI